jgi:hypothetical protein
LGGVPPHLEDLFRVDLLGDRSDYNRVSSILPPVGQDFVRARRLYGQGHSDRKFGASDVLHPNPLLCRGDAAGQVFGLAEAQLFTYVRCDLEPNIGHYLEPRLDEIPWRLRDSIVNVDRSRCFLSVSRILGY